MFGRFNSWTTAQRVARDLDLRGKYVLVTGANAGIGLETARVLAGRGAHVWMACRCENKAAKARGALMARGIDGDLLEPLKLDLADLDSVARCADGLVSQQVTLDVLLNNAGLISKTRGETRQGFETHFGVNHLGHFLFTIKLLPVLRRSQAPRAVHLSSDAMQIASTDARFSDLQWTERDYDTWVSYGDSKLMNLLFSRELAEREPWLVSHAVHPGMVPTSLVGEPDTEALLLALRGIRHMRPVWQGAASSVYAAVHERTREAPSGYFAFCRPHPQHPFADRSEVREVLWDISQERVAGWLS